MKFTSIVVMFFFLSFSASAGTFIETFDDKDMKGWQELVELDKERGLWEVDNDELHAVSRETHLRLLTTGDDTWTDYTIEFDVKPEKKHGVGEITIAARVTDTYSVLCSIEDPVVLLDGEPLHEERIRCGYRNLHDAIVISFYDEPHPLLTLKKWSHLKLSVEGDMITFSINGKQMMEPRKIPNLIGVQHPALNLDGFPDFLTGGVGFGIANYTARFDNITVTGDSIPNRGGFAVTPQGKLALTWSSLKGF